MPVNSPNIPPKGKINIQFINLEAIQFTKSRKFIKEAESPADDSDRHGVGSKLKCNFSSVLDIPLTDFILISCYIFCELFQVSDKLWGKSIIIKLLHQSIRLT